MNDAVAITIDIKADTWREVQEQLRRIADQPFLAAGDARDWLSSSPHSTVVLRPLDQTTANTLHDLARDVTRLRAELERLTTSRSGPRPPARAWSDRSEPWKTDRRRPCRGHRR